MPSSVSHGASGAQAEFFGSARNLGNPGPDPTVEVRRVRRLDGPTLVEVVAIASRADEPVVCEVRIGLAADGAPISDVKSGHLDREGAAPQVSADAVAFSLDRHTTTVAMSPAPTRVEVGAAAPGDAATAVFELVVDPGDAVEVALTVGVRRTAASALDADPGSDAVAVPRPGGGCRPTPGPLFEAVDDLRHLLLRDPEAPARRRFAAGTPWYLALRPRLAVGGPDDAAVRHRARRRHAAALARRQGHPRWTEREAPGKVPHELRRTAYVDPESGLALPPVYYGTVDATALWVTLLAEARQWGMPEHEVRALLPNLRAAVDWLTGPGQPDADGFLKYLDATGSGLANQGWKDSVDSIRWRDGRVATAPIALVEAQAYAVEALTHAAHLLRRWGRAARTPWTRRPRSCANAWSGTSGWSPTPAATAIALDGSGAAVDGLGSNMGHVLGTGTLTPAESALVAATVTGEEMLDPAVRTLGAGNGGFNPIGYHTGSIWTTPPSPRGAWPATATPRRPARSPARCSPRRRRSTTAGPSCTPAAR